MDYMPKEYFKKMKDIEKKLVSFLEKHENPNENFTLFDEYLQSQKIQENKYELKSFLYIMVAISSYYHCSQCFFTQNELILTSLKERIQFFFTNFEVFNIFQKSKLLLLILFKLRIIIPTKEIYSAICNKKYIDRKYIEYFYPEFEAFILQDQIKELRNTTLDDEFNKKRENGKNDNYLCRLIQNDAVVDFITYLETTNISPQSVILPSIYETNLFLINKNPTLIEYSAFYGSIQIFQYLYNRNAEIQPSIWPYAIHGRNAEIIHMIEENHIKPKDESYTECFFNSIKCYHNEIATYIHDNLYDKEKQTVTKRRIIRIINLYCDLEEKKFNTSDEVVGLKIIKTFNIEFFSEVHLTHFDNKSSLFKNNLHLSYVEFLLWTNDDSNKSLILQIASHNKNYSSIIDFILSTSTEIEPAAFERSSIQKITIPNSIRLIGNDSFCESLKLTEVVIPSSVVEIGKKAFYGCHSLQKVVLSKSIKKLGDFVFSQCSSLRQIIIPSSVTHIGDYAFNRCKSLSFVSMPSSVISIGKYAFRECKSLKEITIPSPVTKIGEHAFNNSSLKYALFISSNKSIEDNVFPPQTYVFQIILD